MDLVKQTGRIDRSKFRGAHNNTVYCQPLFDRLSPEEIKPGAFAYGPCWAVLDPGMAVEAHAHPEPEFYIFTAGRGRMRLGGEAIDVEAGTAVNIPSNVVHAVSNPTSAPQPLVWASIGLKA